MAGNLPADRQSWLREISAGLTGAIGSVPDGMATAILAGANPMAGLYASIAGPITGGIVSSSRLMVIATTSAAAVTSANALGGADGNPVRTLATLTALSGLVMLALTALGFVRLLRFVSASVMAGFMFGVGLTLILGQAADAAGVSAQGDSVLLRFVDTVRQVSLFDVTSLLVAGGAIVIALVLNRTRAANIGPMVALVVPAVLLAITSLHVATVSDVATVVLGLPPLVLPDLTLVTPQLVGGAVAVAVVVLVQAAGVHETYPDADGRRRDLRRDLDAQGVANLASAVMGGIPVGASNGQTALNVMAGARTRAAVVISGVWMLVFVVALGPLLARIPIPALAGLLILAGFDSLRPRRLARSWRTGKASGAAAIVTLVATLTLPIPLAVLTGVLLSLVLVGITSATLVRVVGLERIESGGWRRGPVAKFAVPGSVVVVDLEGSLAFSSVERAFRRLPQAPPGDAEGGAVVLRMKGHLRTNLTFVVALEQYAEQLRRREIRLIIAGPTPKAIDQLTKVGLDIDQVLVVPESDVLGGALEAAYEIATRGVNRQDPT